jgi:DNA-binding MurR/RpiR family transcriptional regulator
MDMAKKGQSFTDQELQRITSLLSTTDMTIGEIAQRMQCSRSSVATVNRRFGIRDYGGLRATWVLQERAGSVAVKAPAQHAAIA